MISFLSLLDLFLEMFEQSVHIPVVNVIKQEYIMNYTTLIHVILWQLR